MSTLKVASFLYAQGETFSSRLYRLRMHVNEAMFLHIVFFFIFFLKEKTSCLHNFYCFYLGNLYDCIVESFSLFCY